MTRSNIQCFPPFPSPFFFSYANQIFSFSKFFSFSSPVLAKYFPSPNIFLLFLFLCYELSFSTPSHNMDIGGGVVIIVGKGQTDRDRQPWYCYQAIFPAPCKEASFFLHLLAFLTTPWAKIYTNVVFTFFLLLMLYVRVLLKAKTTLTFHFSIITLSNALFSINNREMKCESGFSLLMASPFTMIYCLLP